MKNVFELTFQEKQLKKKVVEANGKKRLTKSKIKRITKEVKESGFFLEPMGDEGELVENPFYQLEDKYSRLDLVIDSGAFASAPFGNLNTGYPILPLRLHETDGGRTATGEEVKIVGRRKLQVNLMGTTHDFMMNFKVIEGIRRPLGSITELGNNRCQVVFDDENEGGSYIFNQRRNEY